MPINCTYSQFMNSACSDDDIINGIGMDVPMTDDQRLQLRQIQDYWLDFDNQMGVVADNGGRLAVAVGVVGNMAALFVLTGKYDNFKGAAFDLQRWLYAFNLSY